MSRGRPGDVTWLLGSATAQDQPPHQLPIVLQALLSTVPLIEVRLARARGGWTASLEAESGLAASSSHQRCQDQDTREI